MSGGSKNNAAATAQQAQPQLPTLQMRAFHPNHIGLLSRQMSKGFGAPQAQNLGLLQSIYSDQALPLVINGKMLEAWRDADQTSPQTSAGHTLTPNQDDPAQGGQSNRRGFS